MSGYNARFYALMLSATTFVLNFTLIQSIFSLGSTLGSVASGILTLYLPYSTIFLIGAALNLGSIPAILAMRKDS